MESHRLSAARQLLTIEQQRNENATTFYLRLRIEVQEVFANHPKRIKDLIMKELFIEKLRDEHQRGAIKVLNPRSHTIALEQAVSFEIQDREVRSAPPCRILCSRAREQRRPRRQ